MKKILVIVGRSDERHTCCVSSAACWWSEESVGMLGLLGFCRVARRERPLGQRPPSDSVCRETRLIEFLRNRICMGPVRIGIGRPDFLSLC